MSSAPSRRDFLNLLGLGTAGVAVAPLAGCGAGRFGVPRAPLTPDHSGYQVSDAVDQLRRRRRPGDPFLVGAAAVNITPRDLRHAWLGGYGFERKARGVLDPLWVRAFYFDDGAQPLWLICADLVGFQYPSVQRIRRLISPTWGHHAVLSATHNHDAPDTIGLWGPSFMYLLPIQSGLDRRYLTWVERAVAVAAVRAAQTARPARLELATATVPEDRVINLRRPGVFDKTMTIIRARSVPDDTVIGTLVHFACHPESLGDFNHYVSSDFVGFMYETVERGAGGICGFFQGAVGALITSTYDKHASLATRYRYTQLLGRELGRRAVAALQRPTPLPGHRITLRRTEVRFPITTDLFRLIHALDLPLLERPLGTGAIVSEVGLVELGSVSMALTPGEPSPEIGFRAQRLVPGAPRLVLGLCNDEVGYILTPTEARDPLYGYEAGVSPGPATGEITLAALQRLAAMPAATAAPRPTSQPVGRPTAPPASRPAQQPPAPGPGPVTPPTR